jgi:hypothetical protein
MLSRLTIVVALLLGSAHAHACVHCAYASALYGANLIAGVHVAGGPVFTTPRTATSTVEMKNAKVMYDQTQWKKLGNETGNEAIDENFEHVDGNIRAIAVSLRDFVPLDDFIEGFVAGMAEDAPDTKVVSRRDVTVNGVPMAEITVDMVTQEAPIRYHGFVHSGAKGVCLVLGICHRDLFAEVQPLIVGLASGLTVSKPQTAPEPATTPAATTSKKKKK